MAATGFPVLVTWGTNSVEMRVSPEATFSMLKVECEQTLKVTDVVFSDVSEEMGDLIVSQVLSHGQQLAVTFGGVAPLVPVSYESKAVEKLACEKPDPKPPFQTRQALDDLRCILEDQDTGWALFLSGHMGASDKRALLQLKIANCLNLCERVPCKFPSFVSYKVLPIFDTKDSDIAAHFDAAIAFIEEARLSGRRCLVHCLVGASRSAAIVLAYLVSKRAMTLRDAFTLVRARREVARPNKGFCEKLIEFEFTILGRRTMTVERFGHKK
mmetsp:Transcript_7676/g.17726  ORF Transcript_7676/g.17726 Transcript_7676/m.17726 type:complete len:270 (+) Transcript_7676:44-853(+)|eukprot:CAMPEP_0114556098 /NCGR_PEP_ID=MMETSP0114-20121206/9113_1 /TAXON_ID=31324 /ORGANISM="Goniomonas sp, Strain m" /LENGTH=269 /DNA_ID=CAMNT_0001741291 /DNA_START=44 /DNA_END=853 /DNA_ORIENTATION=+